jgi:hypothetical protein
MSKVFTPFEGPITAFTANHPILASQRWGIDIVGKLTPTQGNYTFIVVAVEYFSKWVKAKHVTNASSATIKKFF